MAVQSWVGLHAFVGGFDIACTSKSMSAPQVTAAALDTTALCDTNMTYIQGLKSTTWTAEAMQDHDTDKVDQLVGLSALGVEVPISVLPAGETEGSVAYAFNANQFNYSPSASAGELAMATVSGVGTGSPTVRGTLMHPHATARTSSGTTTGVQVGAVSASQRMYASLHVLSASGTSPTLDVIVESDDNSGFTSDTDRITFTQATGIGSEWSSVAGAVTDDYWRIRYTIGGTNPSFTFAVVIGIAAP